MITVREIAEFAGVSKSTVSLVLNNKSGVSEQMRKTVFDARMQLESIHADKILPEESDNTPKSQTFSVMVLHPPVLRSSSVFSMVLQGIQNTAELYNLQLRLVANNPEATEQHVSNLYLTEDYLRPDGVIIFGAKKHEPILKKITDLEIPCVVLGREAKKYKISGIERDELYYGYLLTKHLIDLGHQIIAFVGGETDYDYTHNRIMGYKKAFEEANLPIDQRLIQIGDGVSATEAILSLNLDVTAIVFVNDTYAEEGLSIIQGYDLTIPDDISITSFDNTKFAQDYQPSITSIAYNHFKEGQWAVKILLDEIRNPFIKQSQLEFDGTLILRNSAAPPRF
jgi:DNA-binding LacI/PurR family transcriptional regulator